MRILIMDNDSEEVYETIPDATASQIAAYTAANVIKSAGHELIVEDIVVDYYDQDVIILVK